MGDVIKVWVHRGFADSELFPSIELAVASLDADSYTVAGQPSLTFRGEDGVEAYSLWFERDAAPGRAILYYEVRPRVSASSAGVTVA